MSGLVGGNCLSSWNGNDHTSLEGIRLSNQGAQQSNNEQNSESIILVPVFFRKMYLLKTYSILSHPRKSGDSPPKQNHPQNLWAVSTRCFHPTSPRQLSPNLSLGFPHGRCSVFRFRKRGKGSLVEDSSCHLFSM